MTIAYLRSQFPFYSQTIVLNEVEAHQQAGIDVVPLSCSRVRDATAVSESGKVI